MTLPGSPGSGQVQGPGLHGSRPGRPGLAHIWDRRGAGPGQVKNALQKAITQMHDLLPKQYVPNVLDAISRCGGELSVGTGAAPLCRECHAWRHAIRLAHARLSPAPFLQCPAPQRLQRQRCLQQDLGRVRHR
eukprot:9469029-Pyramimonas_sp.AAC.1